MEFSTLNGYKVKDKKAIRSYDTLALMQSDTKLKEGQRVKTKGYYTANDGGHGEYEIVNQTLTSDGGSIIELSNGLYAKLIVENGIINAKQFGIENNETCTEKLQTMVNLYNNIKIEDLILNIDDTISLHSDLKIDIVNSTINQLSVSNKKYIFYLNNCNNVIINGNKSILIGQKPTEVTQQAGISIENGCKNIIIQGLTLSSFGGDGLTLGGTENNISNNLSIKNCVITNNLRNGISLIGGLDSVYIENCDINLSSGVSPQAGIDIETWKNTLFNNNIFIYKNKFSENVSGGLKIFENSKNIFIENNIFGTDNRLYLNLNTSYKNIPENAPNNINIKRNIFENSAIYGENQLGVINIEGNEINSNSENSIVLNFFDGISNVYQSPKNIEKNILNKQISVDGCSNLSIHNNAYKNVTGRILYTIRTKYIKFYENDIVGYNIGDEITSGDSSSIIYSNNDVDLEIYNNNVIKTQNTVNVNNFVFSHASSREVFVHDNNLNDTEFSLALYGGSWVGQEGIAFRNRDNTYLNMPMREFPTPSIKYVGVSLTKLESSILNTYTCKYDTSNSVYAWVKEV